MNTTGWPREGSSTDAILAPHSPKAMSEFDPSVFTDADMQKVIALLESLGQ
jgi:hypothetical protein